MNIYMSLNECKRFMYYAQQSKTYAEFGSGGSTTYIDTLPNIESAISIESDPVFADKVRSMCKKVRVVHADIGPVKPWGYPADTSDKGRLAKYSSAPIGPPDTILVDGRFRVACILRACLDHPNALLIVHDFWCRPSYHCVLEFLDVVERVESLMVARVKSENNRSRILELYELYKDDSD